MEGLGWRRYALIALAVLQLQIWMAILATGTVVLLLLLLLLLKTGVHASVIRGTLGALCLIGILSLIDLLLGLLSGAGLNVILLLATLACLIVE